MIPKLTGLFRNPTQNYESTLLESAYNQSFGVEYNLPVEDFQGFYGNWPNTDPNSLTESLLCMGKKANDYLSGFNLGVGSSWYVVFRPIFLLLNLHLSMEMSWVCPHRKISEMFKMSRGVCLTYEYNSRGLDTPAWIDNIGNTDFRIQYEPMHRTDPEDETTSLFGTSL